MGVALGKRKKLNQWQKLLPRIMWSGLLVSGFTAAVLPLAAQQTAAAATSSPQTEAKLSEFPDSPGATAASQSAQPAEAQVQQPSPPSQDLQTQKPVGTAAAEAPNASGIAASQPAGVAIAPAKQRRVRTIMIRVGAIVGAGVAVGSVIALTAATPSKPPGAH
jgi:hypothetical protein